MYCGNGVVLLVLVMARFDVNCKVVWVVIGVHSDGGVAVVVVMGRVWIWP